MQERPDQDEIDYECDGEAYHTCPECGGYMSWCTCCEMWTQNCCVEWGTCQCS